MPDQAFQDQIPRNHCWGCGPDNEHGLRIKSYWAGAESVCTWQPKREHMAGPTHIVNGGIIATIIDCHCICTAIADAYRRENRPMSEEPLIWYVTAGLNVTYLHPTPISAPITLLADITECTAKKTELRCTVLSEGDERARAVVVAVRVPPEWRERAGPR